MKASYRKRLLSLLLVLTMLLSLCPAAFAEETESEEEEIVFIDEPETPEEAETEEALEEEAEEESALPCGFVGMGEGWEPSAQELDMKQSLLEYDTVAQLEQLTPDVDYIEGEVFFVTDSEEYAEQVAAAYNAQLKSYRYGVAVLQLLDATTLEAVAAGADPALPLPAVAPNHIVTVEPDWGDTRDPSALSGAESELSPARLSWAWWKNYFGDSIDPYLADPTALYYQQQHDVMNSYEAWGITRGAGVTVAVLDSGVDVTHEDLRNNNTAEPIDLFDCNNQDLDEHGTHVAGIVAAEAGNGLGGAGIAPEAGILSVRVFGPNGGGSDAIIISGIYAAVEASAADPSIKVINMSLGGNYYDPFEEQALLAAADAGITVVVAMGNDPTNCLVFPAAYDVPGLIAVGASMEAGPRSSYSNYGPWEDVLAPGSAILSSLPGNEYTFYSGTSMATPAVAGVCALYLSVYPDATPVEVEAAIKAATTNGVVDAAKLFEKDQTPPTIEAADSVAYGDSISILPGSVSDFVVYTTDGKAPAVKDGVVSVGNTLSGGSFELEVTAENGFAPGQKVTVKAVSVSGLGVVSKAVSKAVTVGYAAPTDITIPPVSKVSAGKSLTLSAAVEPAEARQAVVWEIIAKDGCYNTALNAKTGVLSTKASDSGTVTVRATHPDDATLTATLTVEIGKPTLTKKLMLDLKKLDDLYISSQGGTERVVSVSALDASGKALDGVVLQWSSSNPKVAVVENNDDGTATVAAVGKGKATVTVKAMDGSNVKASLSVEVKQAAEEVTVSGPLSIAPGKSAGYKAAVSPASASDKSVVWSLSGAPEGVSIDARSGKLTASGAVMPGESFELIASSKDGYAFGNVTVTTRRQIGAIKIRSEGGGTSVVTDAKTGAIKSAKLFCAAYRAAFEETDEQYATTLLRLYATDEYNEPVDALWSSSNPKVAVVEPDGTVLAVGAGNAVISCAALDSSGKTAKMNVTVTNPPSGVSVVSKSNTFFGDRYRLLALGKSVGNSVKLADAFGKPTSTKVVWTQRTFLFDREEDIKYWLFPIGDMLDTDTLLREAEANGGVEYFGEGITVSANGLVKADKSLSDTLDQWQMLTWVTATTTDGSNLSGGVAYVLCSPIKKIDLRINPSDEEGWVPTKAIEISLDEDEYLWIAADADSSHIDDYLVSSSDPFVAGGLITSFSGFPFLQVMSGLKTGTATLTVRATDGSGATAKLKVKVVAPSED